MKVDNGARNKLSVGEKPSVVRCGVRSITSALRLRIYSCCSEFGMKGRAGTLLILRGIVRPRGRERKTSICTALPPVGRSNPVPAAIRLRASSKPRPVLCSGRFCRQIRPAVVETQVGEMYASSGCRPTGKRDYLDKVSFPIRVCVRASKRHRLGDGQTFSRAEDRQKKKHILRLKEPLRERSR